MNIKKHSISLQPKNKNEQEFLQNFLPHIKDSFKKPTQLISSGSHSTITLKPNKVKKIDACFPPSLKLQRTGRTNDTIFEKIYELFSPSIFLLEIPKNTIETFTIQTLPFSHLIIRVGKNAKVTLIENFEKKETHSSLSKVEVIMEKDAHVTYLFPQTNPLQNHVFIKNASVQKNAELTWLPHIINENNVYTNITTWLEQGAVKLYGTYFSQHSEKLHLAYTTYHIKAGVSNMHIYGISKDSSCSHFYGTIHIGKNGKNANGNLKEQCLLLNAKAKHSAMPILEIKTNDIQAKHASSTTKVNENHLFYLTSRGMTKKEAKQQIIMSFLENALQYIPIEEEKENVYKVLQKNIK